MKKQINQEKKKRIILKKETIWNFSLNLKYLLLTKREIIENLHSGNPHR